LPFPPARFRAQSRRITPIRPAFCRPIWTRRLAGFSAKSDSASMKRLMNGGNCRVRLWHGFIAHLVLPVATLTLTLLAHVTRLTRSSMMEALDSMYVKVARARGLPERLGILRHALRNALIPSITVLAQDFGFLIGGIVAVETVFAYPGLGRMLVGSL